MKKLRKELNKLLPSDLKVCKMQSFDIDIHDGNRMASIDFNIKEKKQKHEWIRIIAKDNIYLPYGHLFNISGRKVTDDNCICLNGIDGFAHYIDINQTIKATPAEIEAHKLGFHVGDEVWLNEKSNFNHKTSFIITEIGYNFGKKGIMSAKFRKEDSLIYEYIDCLTKTPPKQPIFQIDGKDMFEGDEYWFLLKKENWKLKEETVIFSNSPQYDNINCKRFSTKQDALNYILEEAKRRFEGCKQIKHNEFGIIPFNEGIHLDIYNSGQRIIFDKFHSLWKESEGFVSEPIKQPKLMLGNEVVTIEKVPSTKKQYIDTGNMSQIIIKAKDGKVTKEEWLSWYNFIKVAREMSLGMDIITGRLGVYSGTYYKKDKTFIIGCIGKNDTKRATLEQIEAITKELTK